jgi:hypothetical protein
MGCCAGLKRRYATRFTLDGGGPWVKTHGYHQVPLRGMAYVIEWRNNACLNGYVFFVTVHASGAGVFDVGCRCGESTLAPKFCFLEGVE